MNILVCGVGGQGVLLFSDIIAEVALSAGLDVKKAEEHGMAQRGGSVTGHIRYAPKVYSPIIEEGTADIIVAFEMMEALRYVHFLGPNGRLILDPHRIDPLPISTGAAERPTDESLNERLSARVRRTEAENRDCTALSPTQALRGTVPRFPQDAGNPATSCLVRIPAFATALELGSSRVQNVVMLGAVSCFLEFPAENFQQAITRLVKPKALELNLKAFAAGRGLGA